MMRKIMIIMMLAMGVVSCSEKAVEEHEVADVENGLQLNNGQKWEVNPETHEGMKQIKTILENSDPLSVEDYQTMGEACSEQTSFIISNCSMEGKAHNQLHHVLHPILDAIDGLTSAEDTEQGEVVRKELENHIVDYFNYFTL